MAYEPRCEINAKDCNNFLEMYTELETWPIIRHTVGESPVPINSRNRVARQVT